MSFFRGRQPERDNQSIKKTKSAKLARKNRKNEKMVASTTARRLRRSLLREERQARVIDSLRRDHGLDRFLQPRTPAMTSARLQVRIASYQLAEMERYGYTASRLATQIAGLHQAGAHSDEQMEDLLAQFFAEVANINFLLECADDEAGRRGLITSCIRTNAIAAIASVVSLHQYVDTSMLSVFVFLSAGQKEERRYLVECGGLDLFLREIDTAVVASRVELAMMGIGNLVAAATEVVAAPRDYLSSPSSISSAAAAAAIKYIDVRPLLLNNGLIERCFQLPDRASTILTPAVIEQMTWMLSALCRDVSLSHEQTALISEMFSGLYLSLSANMAVRKNLIWGLGFIGDAFFDSFSAFTSEASESGSLSLWQAISTSVSEIFSGNDMSLKAATLRWLNQISHLHLSKILSIEPCIVTLCCALLQSEGRERKAVVIGACQMLVKLLKLDISLLSAIGDLEQFASALALLLDKSYGPHDIFRAALSVLEVLTTVPDDDYSEFESNDIYGLQCDLNAFKYSGLNKWYQHCWDQGLFFKLASSLTQHQFTTDEESIFILLNALLSMMEAYLYVFDKELPDELLDNLPQEFHEKIADLTVHGHSEKLRGVASLLSELLPEQSECSEGLEVLNEDMPLNGYSFLRKASADIPRPALSPDHEGRSASATSAVSTSSDHKKFQF